MRKILLHTSWQSAVECYRWNTPMSDPVSGGHMVVSMRPYREEDVPKVATITGEYPAAHGALS